MMPHVSRHRVLGGAIVLIAVAVITAAVPAARSITAGAMPPVAAVAACTALCAVAPHAFRAVRAAAPTRNQQHRVCERQQRLARLMVGLTAGAVAAVAVVAVLLNYAHGVDVARWNTEPTWRSLLYPLPADGLLVSSSLVLVWQLLATGGTTWRPRLAFVVGIIASAGTNVLAACHTDLHGFALVERVVWTTWPTAALLAAHEMLLLMLTHYATAAGAFGQREQTAKAKQEAAEHRAAAAEAELARARDELAQHQEETAARGQEIAELQAEIEHLSTVGTERTMDDWADLRALVPAIVEHYQGEGRPLAGTDVARVLAVSVRWAQKHMPTEPSTNKPPELATATT